MSTRRNQHGVTLPEMLIALLVFAMISSVGVYALRLTIDGHAQLTKTDQRLREWQLSRLIIRQDLAQIRLRTVRDEFGSAQRGPFIGGFGFSGRTPVSDEKPLVGFVRAGWSNYDNALPRSTLQKVEYLLVGDDIVRRTQPYLDDARNQRTIDRVLFKDVENVSLTFLHGETSRGLSWVEDWPVSGAGSASPQALRLLFSSARYGEIEQLFWVGDLSGAVVQ